MKKNLVIAALSIVCCLSLVLAGLALHVAISAEENISTLDACYVLDNERMDEIEKNIETIKKNNVEYINDFGGLFHANGKPVQQGYIHVEEDYLMIEKETFVDVCFAQNMLIPENNSDPEADRYYYFENPDEVGYLVVRGVESGFAIVTVVKGGNK